MVYTCLHYGLCWSRTKDEQMHDSYRGTAIRWILLRIIKVCIVLDTAMSFNLRAQKQLQVLRILFIGMCFIVIVEE